MSTEVTTTPQAEVATTKTGTPVYLQSRDVIVQAPFSYAGATLRILRGMQSLTARATGLPTTTGQQTAVRGLALAGAYSLVSLVLLTAWTGVTAWYMTFGLAVVPYRLIRRSDRNRKRQQLQHEELMAATLATAQQRNQ